MDNFLEELGETIVAMLKGAIVLAVLGCLTLAIGLIIFTANHRYNTDEKELEFYREYVRKKIAEEKEKGTFPSLEEIRQKKQNKKQ